MDLASEQYKMSLYKLKKDIPLCRAGTIFYYDHSDNVLGSEGAGCLKLAWGRNGNAQKSLDVPVCADTVVFHADARFNVDWFEKVKSTSRKERFIKSTVTYNGKTLYEKVESV